MLNRVEKNYHEWLKKANEDDLNAKSILTNQDGAPSGVCFFSQQIAEKYLKGLLVFKGKDFPKVHDLIELETLLIDLFPEIKNYDKELDLLNSYYIETRYPGDYPEFTWEDAEEALEAAMSIKDFVLEKIGK